MSEDRCQPRVRVAGIIIKDGAVLMIAHKKGDARYWLLPGGGVACMETLDEALRREFIEELSIEVEVGDVALIADSIDTETDRHIINICFMCRHLSGEHRLGTEEILDSYGYFKPEDLADMTVYPPINSELKSIVQGMMKSIYLGRLWLKK